MNAFDQILAERKLPLRRGALRTLQINVGRKCNQACRHCHVDAAPWRTEMLDDTTAHRIGEWISLHKPEVVDITGGAPELSEYFRYLVETARNAGSHVIDRNNLTILSEQGFETLPQFLAEHQVEVIASLPCYLEQNVRKQRGNGVFARSIAGLRKLNAEGYGTMLPLHLVYNPLGPTLPPAQEELEADYKEALLRDHGIIFNKLFTLANLPIARFANDLREQGKWEEYLELLKDSFNPDTVESLMCRSTLSVGYQGEIYDCDFNQMLRMQIQNGNPLFLWDVTPKMLEDRAVATGAHCFGCTAGAGSSCTGALAKAKALQGGYL
ncbi:MAG: arsenosugar biosynthesis radical SAM (seleno)protein ArsS [Verrucomicrobiales bacterium]